MQNERKGLFLSLTGTRLPHWVPYQDLTLRRSGYLGGPTPKFDDNKDDDINNHLWLSVLVEPAGRRRVLDQFITDSICLN